MLLVAASRGDVIPEAIGDEASAFFKLQNFSKAQQYLESYLESNGIECAVPTAVVNLWHQGCFLWANPITPSGFAASVVASKDIIFNDSIHEGILLDFSTKHEISKSSLHKLTKTQVMYPPSVELTLERIEAITAFAKLFFSERSYLTKGLIQLMSLCKTNRLILRTKFYLDKLFLAKFLFTIDYRINKWLTECGRVKTVEDIDLNLIDFSIIISDMKLNRFICELPESTKVIKDKNDSNIEVGSSTTPTNNKKRRISNDHQAQTRIVIN